MRKGRFKRDEMVVRAKKGGGRLGMAAGFLRKPRVRKVTPLAVVPKSNPVQKLPRVNRIRLPQQKH